MDVDSLAYSAKQCAALIKRARAIAVLTGAGISTNAGIADFRGPRGLYVTRQYDAGKVFDIDYFVHDPKLFYDFARDFIYLQKQIKPTYAHNFLAKLEASGKLLGVITQNIDSLHQRAGSTSVYELHGSFEKSYCRNCQKTYGFDQLQQAIETQVVPLCDCGGVIKPDIVFFGEDVKFFTAAEELAKKADLFFLIGTTCFVYPAAQIPSFTSGSIVIVNKGKVEVDFDNVLIRVNDDADEFFRRVDGYL